MLGWDWHGVHKKRVGTHYTELVFLHLVGFADCVVHFSACRARSVQALFSMLGSTQWDLRIA
jgi:hypothetical protein